MMRSSTVPIVSPRWLTTELPTIFEERYPVASFCTSTRTEGTVCVVPYASSGPAERSPRMATAPATASNWFLSFPCICPSSSMLPDTEAVYASFKNVLRTRTLGGRDVLVRPATCGAAPQAAIPLPQKSPLSPARCRWPNAGLPAPRGLRCLPVGRAIPRGAGAPRWPRQE
jgi:hypothetical protein